MAGEAIELRTVEEWEQWRKDASGRLCVIFKYSPICGLSRGAEKEFETWRRSLPATTDTHAAKVNVIDARAVSQRIAADLGVEHKSPQALVIGRDGAVVWHASHFDIRADHLASRTAE